MGSLEVGACCNQQQQLLRWQLCHAWATNAAPKLCTWCSIWLLFVVQCVRPFLGGPLRLWSLWVSREPLAGLAPGLSSFCSQISCVFLCLDRQTEQT